MTLTSNFLLQTENTAASSNSTSTWMQLWSAVFTLDWEYEALNAAPGVEEEDMEERGCRSRSASRLSALCWLNILWFLEFHTAARLPLAVNWPDVWSLSFSHFCVPPLFPCFLHSQHNEYRTLSGLREKCIVKSSALLDESPITLPCPSCFTMLGHLAHRSGSALGHFFKPQPQPGFTGMSWQLGSVRKQAGSVCSLHSTGASLISKIPKKFL